MNPRYDGKPLLRLLECYVLRAIERLPDDQSAALTAMEPKLAQVYGATGPWHEIIRAQMDFPETLPASLKQLFEKNVETAKKNGQEIDPEQFAQAIVDHNFL